MRDSPIDYAVNIHIAHISLNRPAVRNAVNPEVLDRLTAALHKARTDESVKAVCLTGAGKSFCAGGDARYQPVAAEAGWNSLHGLINEMDNYPKPIVAGVQGHAIGIGCALALLSDFVIATNDCVFRLPFVAMGLVPEGTKILTRLAREPLCNAMILLGEPCNGARAHREGMIYLAVEPAALDDAVTGLLEKLRQFPVSVYADLKAAIRNSRRLNMSDMLRWEMHKQIEIRKRPGYAEFRKAFFARAGVRAD